MILFELHNVKHILHLSSENIGLLLICLSVTQERLTTTNLDNVQPALTGT
jgi:hypothetical protein